MVQNTLKNEFIARVCRFIEVDHAPITVEGVLKVLMERNLIEDVTIKEFLTLENYPFMLQKHNKRNTIQMLSFKYGVCERKCWQLVKNKRFKFAKRRTNSI